MRSHREKSEEGSPEGEGEQRSSYSSGQTPLEPISNELAEKVVRLLGLGMRGRLVCVGVELTRNAVMSNKVQVAVVALDASHNSRDKIVPLLTARGVNIIAIASADLLGGAVGRATTTVVGVLDKKLALGVRAACGDIRR